MKSNGVSVHAQSPRQASVAQSLDGNRLTGSLLIPGADYIRLPIPSQARAESMFAIAQAIDLYSRKSRRQREQRDGLQAIMRWSAEQRIADRGGDEYAVLLALQQFTRRTLQLRGDPDVPAVEKRTERVKRSTVQPDADRAAELFLVPNCVPASGQTLRPCNGLRGLAERHAIGISEIETHGTAKFLRAATS